jgi:LacI family transcriptional regulator, galactose operon repressor
VRSPPRSTTSTCCSSARPKATHLSRSGSCRTSSAAVSTAMLVPDEPGRTGRGTGSAGGWALRAHLPRRRTRSGRRRRSGTHHRYHAGAVGAADSPAGTVESLCWPEAAYPARVLGPQEAGLAIPEDVSIVSFDDSDLASWLRPQLTSISIPYFELGRRAVELLLTDQRGTGVQRIPMPLRSRGSVGRLRRATENATGWAYVAAPADCSDAKC